MKILFVMLGFLFFALGAVGTVVPVLPSTPFLLLAAFFFARGSERFNSWFLSTALYKKHLESFIQSRSMTLKTKVFILSFASTMLTVAFIVTDLLFLRLFILLVAVYKYYYFVTKIKTIPSEKPRESTNALDNSK
ncbi:MAG: hypothetical protein K0Q90_4409 [Paenibacillaceae bacterium]|nr:hypothetical protein [Paenibacillaceae bacterium]